MSPSKAIENKLLIVVYFVLLGLTSSYVSSSSNFLPQFISNNLIEVSENNDTVVRRSDYRRCRVFCGELLVVFWLSDQRYGSTCRFKLRSDFLLIFGSVDSNGANLIIPLFFLRLSEQYSVNCCIFTPPLSFLDF